MITNLRIPYQSAHEILHIIFLEYAQTVHASTMGMFIVSEFLLLEMITGKRPTDSMFEGGCSIINLFVERNFPDQVLHIIDTHLQEECKNFIKAMAITESEVCQCVLSLVRVVLACTRPEGKNEHERNSH